MFGGASGEYQGTVGTAWESLVLLDRGIAPTPHIAEVFRAKTEMPAAALSATMSEREHVKRC